MTTPSLLAAGFALHMLIACPSASAADRYVGTPLPFRGATALKQVLKDRLLTGAGEIGLAGYLGEAPDEFFGSLIPLLGGYPSFFEGTLTGRIENAVPNTVNMLLWYLVSQGIATDIAKNCAASETTGLPLNPAALAAVRGVCAWPTTQPELEAALFELWVTILGFDAPFEEFEAWKTFALGAEMGTLDARARVSALALTAIFNPYLLVRH